MAEVAALATPSIRRQIGNKGRIAEQGALTWYLAAYAPCAAHSMVSPTRTDRIRPNVEIVAPFEQPAEIACNASRVLSRMREYGTIPQHLR
eukprot:scaffold38661_cov34-Tisochrysis_lutea.AAC.3